MKISNRKALRRFSLGSGGGLISLVLDDAEGGKIVATHPLSLGRVKLSTLLEAATLVQTKGALIHLLILLLSITASYAASPVASFTSLTGTPGNLGDVPCTVTFTATNSISGTVSLTNYFGIHYFTWNFGDGSTVVTRNPYQEHTFLWPGSFDVTLTVQNNYTNTATTNRVYVVNAQSSYPGTVYHVKTNGLDSAAGTFAAPWLTLSKAVATVIDGDFVAVHPGRYEEFNDFNRNVAAATNRITFIGYGASTRGAQFRHSNYTYDGFDITSATAVVNGAIYVFPACDNFIVRNCKIHDTPMDLDGVYVSNQGATTPDAGALHGTIFNNIFTNVGSVNIAINQGSNWVVRANQAYDSWTEGDFVRPLGDGHVIEDNFCWNLNNGDTGGHADFFQVPLNSSHVRNITIQRNIVVGNLANWNDDGDAQICQIASGVQGQTTHTNLVWRNNIFYYVRGQANLSIDGAKFYNNLFYLSPRAPTQLSTYGGNNGSGYGTEWYNNIFFACSDGQTASRGWYYNGTGVGSTNTTVFANYNFVCGTNGALKQVAPPDNAFRWAVTGQEANGINGGLPLFVDVPHLDFRLQTNSTLAGAGTVISGFTTDINGLTRSAPWDMGPFAVSGSSDPPPPPPPPPPGTPGPRRGKRRVVYFDNLKTNSLLAVSRLLDNEAIVALIRATNELSTSIFIPSDLEAKRMEDFQGVLIKSENFMGFRW